VQKIVLYPNTETLLLCLTTLYVIVVVIMTVDSVNAEVYWQEAMQVM